MGKFCCTSFRSFQTLHPKAKCWLIAQDRDTIIRRKRGDLEIVECGVNNLNELAEKERNGKRR